MLRTKSKISTTAIVMLCVASILAGCANNQEGARKFGQVVGTVVGVILGGQVGEGAGKAASMALGAGLGALLGDEIARRLSERDREMANATLNETLESGENASWSNPESGNAGTATASDTYAQANTDGRDCRDFETTVYTEDGEHIANGTAWRNDDGSWEVVREPSA
ncbi:MAG: hypothetical protein KAI73_06690 [Rhodospirillaceae bacterium]|nr:hypothetical protein [Rhodospirillaceae bacterium]